MKPEHVAEYVYLLRKKKQYLDSDEYMKALRCEQQMQKLQKSYPGIRDEALERLYTTAQAKRLADWQAG